MELQPPRPRRRRRRAGALGRRRAIPQLRRGAVITRAVAISLKIPDNAAYTALVALRRLGVAAERVERSEIWTFDAGGEEGLAARVEADETIFNPNKHRLTLLDEAAPRAGEVWIARREGGPGPAAVAWRLFDARGVPAGRDVLAAAVERLLCNPAIETAVY